MRETKCRLCPHPDICMNWWNDPGACAGYACSICIERAVEKKEAEKKCLSLKEIREEATIFIISKAEDYPKQKDLIMKFIKKFVMRLEVKALSSTTNQEKQTKKGGEK